MSDWHLSEMADLQPVPEIRLTVETGSLPTRAAVVDVRARPCIEKGRSEERPKSREETPKRDKTLKARVHRDQV